MTTRNSWNIPDPAHHLDNSRRLVKAYKALAGLRTEAEALAELVAAGYRQLSSPVERPPAHRRAGARMRDQASSPERTGGASTEKSRVRKPEA
jgi:hypothetical protein